MENEAYTFLHPENTVVCQVRRSRLAVVDAEDDEEGEDTEAGDVPATDQSDAAATQE